MEKKIGLIVILGTLCAILIFNSLVDYNKDFLVISDGISFSSDKNFNDLFYDEYKDDFNSYNDTYVINYLSVRDLYDLINFNETLDENEYTIKQLINMSDFITISIGIDEINNYENLNIYLYYMDLVLGEIRNINDGEIYLFSLYSNDILISNVNDELNILSEKYNIYFVDIENVLSEEMLIDNSYLPNENGQEAIFNEFVKVYEKLNY